MVADITVATELGHMSQGCAVRGEHSPDHSD